MLPEDIKKYADQFEYVPVVENAKKLKKFTKFAVCGMGGSHLAADLLLDWHPSLDLVIWHNYGLPPLADKDLKDRLIIISSYSGNTEEAIDALQAAKKKKLNFVAMASRGKLIKLAQTLKVPYVQLPDLHMQPRMATGLSMIGMLALMGEKGMLAELKTLAHSLQTSREELRGRDLARRLHGSVPVIYASVRNLAVAKNWKIKFNETGKIPAFWNVVPEVNHNEMTGFDAKGKTPPLSRVFHFVFLKDASDDRRIIKRMNVMEKLFRDRGFKTEIVLMQGKNEIHKIFTVLNLADWTAFYTGKLYGVDPEQVPMVEEFKKLISR
ncbi:MAG TPA: SIS domain-containing protein [Candidatus Paceibacterota bacterium]|nr:SIS domain-containing protein [Candidatus Paceibacterota bacterium]